jgi:hypothetical protein
VGKQRLHLHSGQWRGFTNTNSHICSDIDTNSNSYTDAYSYAHGYRSSKSNANCYGNTDTNSDIDSYTDGNINSNTFTDSNANSDPDAWVWSSGDDNSSAGFDVYFFSRDVPMDRGQRKSVCSNLGEPTERT